MRVTVSRGAERGYRRSAATTRAKPDGRRRWRRCGRVGRCREMASTARLGVGPYRCAEKGALGEREVEKQLHVPCGEPQFEGPQVAK